MATLNYVFCNDDFLPLFIFKPYFFYNQFYIEEFTKSVLDSMGDHPNIEQILFRYDIKKRIRATFIYFDDADYECDVRCICTLFHGDRSDYYCYFFELFEDNTIGCFKVADKDTNQRVLLRLDAGENVDDYFEMLCSYYNVPEDNQTSMVLYLERDDCYRLLDVNIKELPQRFSQLVGGEPLVTNEEICGVQYIVYKSANDSSCMFFRTEDGNTPMNLGLTDVERIKETWN